jgi:hypothetical protein
MGTRGTRIPHTTSCTENTGFCDQIWTRTAESRAQRRQGTCAPLPLARARRGHDARVAWRRAARLHRGRQAGGGRRGSSRVGRRARYLREGGRRGAVAPTSVADGTRRTGMRRWRTEARTGPRRGWTRARRRQAAPVSFDGASGRGGEGSFC